VDKRTIRFGIALTYNCNMACPGCNRFLDVSPWKDSNITLEGLQEGYERAIACVNIEKVRVSGGEPLLHPQFAECMNIIQNSWNKEYGGRTCVFTNGKIQPPPTKGWRYNTSSSSSKEIYFQPPMISPHDLGLEPSIPLNAGCRRQAGCGRLFDAFGFSCCMFAGAIGRLLGIDPYSPTPVIDGMYSICKHCVFAQGIKKAFALFKSANEGEFEYPTRTYKYGLQRLELYGSDTLKKFSER